jgi:hypothetical protein
MESVFKPNSFDQWLACKKSDASSSLVKLFETGMIETRIEEGNFRRQDMTQFPVGASKGVREIVTKCLLTLWFPSNSRLRILLNLSVNHPLLPESSVFHACFSLTCLPSFVWCQRTCPDDEWAVFDSTRSELLIILIVHESLPLWLLMLYSWTIVYCSSVSSQESSEKVCVAEKQPNRGVKPSLYCSKRQF